MSRQTHEMFEINGVSYQLRFNANALADIEDAAGKGLMKLVDEDNIGISTLRLLLWGGLKSSPSNKIKTKEQAGDLIQDYIDAGNTYEDLGAVINRAMLKSGVIGEDQGNL